MQASLWAGREGDTRQSHDFSAKVGFGKTARVDEKGENR